MQQGNARSFSLDTDFLHSYTFTRPQTAERWNDMAKRTCIDTWLQNAFLIERSTVVNVQVTVWCDGLADALYNCTCRQVVCRRRPRLPNPQQTPQTRVEQILLQVEVCCVWRRVWARPRRRRSTAVKMAPSVNNKQAIVCYVSRQPASQLTRFQSDAPLPR